MSTIQHGGIKLHNTSNILGANNKYLDVLLLAFYVQTRGVGINEAALIYQNMSIDEKEVLIKQFQQYSEGKNIEIPVNSVTTDSFHIPTEVVDIASNSTWFLDGVMDYDGQSEDLDANSISDLLENSATTIKGKKTSQKNNYIPDINNISENDGDEIDPEIEELIKIVKNNAAKTTTESIKKGKNNIVTNDLESEGDNIADLDEFDVN